MPCRKSCGVPNWERIWYVADAMRAGLTIDEIFALTYIDRWFLHNIAQIVAMEERLLKAASLLEQPEGEVFQSLLREAKQMGFSDMRLGKLWDMHEDKVRGLRHKLNIRPVYKRVDTCGAEFEAFTPYLYSSYEEECEAEPTDRQQDHDPRRRAEPYRPGHRVRLLLCSRRICPG